MLSRSLICVVCYLALVEAWGPEGHSIIAQLATNFISDTTKSKINTFLGGETLASIASDPDTYRTTPQGKWSAPLHYVDTQKGETNIDVSKDCPNGQCVVNAIYNYTTRLAKDAKSPFKCNLNTNVEPCALVFLTHFVGDAHQPLHAGYASDLGGNNVKVSWYGQSTNLHSVWDSSIISKWNSDYQSATNELLAKIKSNQNYANQFLNTTDALKIADESHYWVRTDVYNFHSNTTNPVVLGAAYYNANLPLVQLRLVAGGIRLAKILDTAMSASNEEIADILARRKTSAFSFVRSA